MSAIDPVYKRCLRASFRLLQGIIAIAGSVGSRSVLRVWYAGARAGDIGGPLVKVQRLKEFFPDCRTSFSHAYLLSNCPYLPGWALRWLKWRGIPIILNQNGVYYRAWFDGDCASKNREMAKAWHLADYVFYQSNFCKVTAEKFLGVRAGPGEVLFNAVDIEHFKPDPKRNNVRPVFLHTGKLVTHMFYRVEALLRGFALARGRGLDAELRIAGWMDLNVQRKATVLLSELALEDRVSFTGPYDQGRAPSVYSAADAYVTLTFNDACPSAVIEALSCGLPVLYSDSGGVPELVSKKSGVGLSVENGYDKVDVPDVEAIAEGLKEILSGLSGRQSAAREHAMKAFDIRNWIGRHRTVFKLISKGK
ncbi:glycosyltransferase family 4 protein [Thalassospira sp. GB04J01]|uniref:glycosyltransferase family 4 protein n=1 Tax=Thalassospira sp. GB04J01 TaxID=1485225 RepID=UPI0011AF2952|nr:glycosyltransferase family 4 protein [Thalassospira sp. GB04J01]